MPRYPVEEEPDGDIWVPHHYWYGLIMLIGGWVWWGSDPIGGWVVLAGLLVLADDVISHFFGVWTPLDAIYHKLLQYRWFRRWWRGVHETLNRFKRQ